MDEDEQEEEKRGGKHCTWTVVKVLQAVKLLTSKR